MTTEQSPALTEASIDPMELERFEDLLAPEPYSAFVDAMRRGAKTLEGRTMWHVNATLKGGGVAEMLGSMLPYVRGAGIACRWLAVDGNSQFFDVTKRLHNLLHGSEGDGGEVGQAESSVYQSTLAEEEASLLPHIEPGDIVFVHDPQTAGLIPGLVDKGALVIWHCHIGADEPNGRVRSAWDFLIEYVSPADRYIFSRAEYLWEDLDPDRLRVISPSIDAFSPKNQHFDERLVDSVLSTAGMIEGNGTSSSFTRTDGSEGTISRKVTIVDEDGALPRDARFVLQAARWDRLKGTSQLIDFFTEHVAESQPDVHLVVSGPSVEGVSDDPEGKEVLEECREQRKSLDPALQERVHLLCSPMEDEDEAAAIVNAQQRRAEVVVQNSLAEGFGLVVAEAMWKKRPVVSSRVGGIQDQIEHGRSGLLVDDPEDGAAFARAVVDLLEDPKRASEMGARAHERVLDRFLTPRQLAETMDVVCEVAG